MTIKVGDTVRVTEDKRDLTVGREYKVIIVDGVEVAVIDDAGDKHYLLPQHYTIVSTTDTTISTQCRERMERHMADGEYVRAVKWAQLAEQAEALENE